MIKRVFIILCVVFLASCGSKKSSLTGKKIKEKELVSKEAYRAALRAKEVADVQQKALESKKKESEVLVATSSVQVTNDIIQEYINSYKEIAKDNMRTHGIPASITLAQGVLESGSGMGTLSRNANNHFGIKCHKEWDGPSVRHTDDAPDECFRKYDNPAESYRDHSLFLVTRSRYSSLFDLQKHDYKGWARGLKNAGYATDPKYADKLISLIDRYTLDQYDKEVLKESGVNVKTAEVKKSPVAKNTNATVHVVKKGDTLYSISKRYNTSVSVLQKKNKLSGSNLSIGQKIKI